MDLLLKLLHSAVKCLGMQRPTEARRLLRAALSAVPALPESLRLASVCASLLEDHEDALRLIGRAVRSAGPQSGPFLSDFASALNNRAIVRARSGDPVGACDDCRCAISLAPEHRDAHANLAALTNLHDAAALWRRAAILVPDHAASRKSLGRALMLLHRTDEARRTLMTAAALMPDGDADLYLLLGNTALSRSEYAAAATCYARSCRLNPSHGAFSNLTLAWIQEGRTARALAAAHCSAALSPAEPGVWMNVGNVLLNRGDAAAAARTNRRILTLRPDSAVAHSNLLMSMQNLGDLPPLELLAEHRRFDKTFGRPRTACHDRHGNVPDPERRLRIGYMSNDFRQHVASCFFEPLLAGHDPERVETICYSDTTQPDMVTRRLIALSGTWRETAEMGEAEFAAQIRADRIDILVDLAGHSAGNRQLVLARRPAPVQATWLGYPDTTGLSAVDYRLVDSITDPEGAADALASETLVRLPDGFLCYRPPQDAPDPGPLPAESGPVTFGSCNRLAKMTPSVISLWAAVLRRVPASRLLIKANGLDHDVMRAHVESRFHAEGIALERLDLVAWTATWREHLNLYRRIDIALDTFPYNGTTTTCEALWMGVPMIGLLGNRHAARVGASLLTRIGLEDLIAATPEAYVETASRLAGDRKRLAGIRAGMRDRMRTSPLCDASRFARSMENAYRAMWRRWCQGTSL